MKKSSSNKNLKRCKRGFGLIFFIMVYIAGIGPALAHKVTIFAWVEGNRVFTESKFSGGKRVHQGDVIVYDSDGNQLLKGKTDDKGEFSFGVPKKTSLKIVLMAGMGHRGEWTIPVSDLEDVAGSQTKITSSRKTAPKKTEKQAEGSHLSSNEMRLTVEEALDKRLRPVMKLLVESLEQHDPTFSDILGGIGYILGLLGVAAYFNYRRKSAEIDGKKTD